MDRLNIETQDIQTTHLEEVARRFLVTSGSQFKDVTEQEGVVYLYVGGPVPFVPFTLLNQAKYILPIIERILIDLEWQIASVDGMYHAQQVAKEFEASSDSLAGLICAITIMEETVQ